MVTGYSHPVKFLGTRRSALGGEYGSSKKYTLVIIANHLLSYINELWSPTLDLGTNQLWPIMANYEHIIIINRLGKHQAL